MAQTFLVCKMHNNRALSILSFEYKVHSMIMHRSFCCSIGAVGRGEHSFQGAGYYQRACKKSHDHCRENLTPRDTTEITQT
jgi:hypothetical protein